MADSTRLITNSVRNILLSACSGIIIRVILLNCFIYYEDNSIAVTNYGSFFNIYMAITLVATIVLFVGMLLKNHYYVIPYLVITIVEIPLTSILLIFDISFIFYSTSFLMCLELILGIALIIWNFFATWLLMFNYRYLEVQHKLKQQIEELDNPDESNA